MRTRVFPESNYRGIYVDDITYRIPMDPTKPITELEYPEFYDVKITNKCFGECPYCYMNSLPEARHADCILQKTEEYFGSMSNNERPFQVAIGGGEPTEHPQFTKLLEKFDRLGITPNYTTNGMFTESWHKALDIFHATKKYCGGVAISCHPHLEEYWKCAAKNFSYHGVKLNFHLIISDRESIDRFYKIYDEFEEIVDYFVLLPWGNQGRACAKEIDYEYLLCHAPKDTNKIAFGANFHSYLKNNPGHFKVSLYEPELLSKFLDYSDMKLYPSSFNLTVIDK
jgi:organic radical activating enzyme